MNTLKFVLSKQNKCIAEFQNHAYYLNSNISKHKTYWECVKRRNFGCKAKLYLKNNEFESVKGTHCHYPDLKFLDSKHFINKLKNAIKESPSSAIPSLYKRVRARYEKEYPDATNLPPYNQVRTLMYSIRSKNWAEHEKDIEKADNSSSVEPTEEMTSASSLQEADSTANDESESSCGNPPRYFGNTNTLNFVLSRQNKCIAEFQNHAYYLHSKINEHKSYWECVKRRNYGCKAKLCLENNEVESVNGTHSHPPDFKYLNSKHFINKLKNAVKESPEMAIPSIYKRVRARYEEEYPDATNLPRYAQVRNVMYNCLRNKDWTERETGIEKADNSSSVEPTEEMTTADTFASNTQEPTEKDSTANDDSESNSRCGNPPTFDSPTRYLNPLMTKNVPPKSKSKRLRTNIPGNLNSTNVPINDGSTTTTIPVNCINMSMNPNSTNVRMNFSSTARPMSPNNSMNMSMNPNFTNVPMNPNSTNVSMNLNSTNVSMNFSSMNMPMNPNSTNIHVSMNPNFTNVPMNPNFTNMPMNPNFTNMPMNPNFTSMPMNPNCTTMSMNPSSTNMPMNPNFTNMPMNLNCTNGPMNFTSTNIPMNTNSTNMPIGMHSGPILMPGFSQEQPLRNNFQIYGNYIAGKLSLMDSLTAAHVQKAIGDIIFEAEMGKYKT